MNNYRCNRETSEIMMVGESVGIPQFFSYNSIVSRSVSTVTAPLSKALITVEAGQ